MFRNSSHECLSHCLAIDVPSANQLRSWHVDSRRRTNLHWSVGSLSHAAFSARIWFILIWWYLSSYDSPLISPLFSVWILVDRRRLLGHASPADALHIRMVPDRAIVHQQWRTAGKKNAALFFMPTRVKKNKGNGSDNHRRPLLLVFFGQIRLLPYVPLSSSSGLLETNKRGRTTPGRSNNLSTRKIKQDNNHVLRWRSTVTRIVS